MIAPDPTPHIPSINDDVCLFAQYDRSGTLPPHTRHTLTRLAQAGLRLHVACAGVARLDPDDSQFLTRIGATGHTRPNHGLDFGSWADLLRAGCATGAPRVVFANDSVFGPFADLRPILDRMNARRLDAWGLVESHERVWHLQSWFLCLTADALARPAVQRVFAQDFTLMSKEEIILHGELGLSVALRAEGLRLDAVWRPAGRLRRVMPVNPSHFDWASMLRTGQVPFLKAELLRDNPANIAWIGSWRQVLARCPDPTPELIEAAIGHPPPIRPAKPLRRLLNLLMTQDHKAALRALFA